MMVTAKSFYHFCAFRSGLKTTAATLLLPPPFGRDGAEPRVSPTFTSKKDQTDLHVSLSDYWPFLTTITTATEQTETTKIPKSIFFLSMTCCPQGTSPFEDHISKVHSISKIMWRGFVVLAVISLLLALKGNLARYNVESFA